MPEYEYKDKSLIKIVEYEVRELNADGDSMDCNHWETKAEALKYAEGCIGGDCVAVVIEKHTSRRPARFFNTPDVYTVIYAKGDYRALEEGGWITPAQAKDMSLLNG